METPLYARIEAEPIVPASAMQAPPGLNSGVEEVSGADMIVCEEHDSGDYGLLR